MIATLPKDLWGLVNYHQHVDPQDLAAAIEDQVGRGDLDYRTCVLIRDSVKALRNYWGAERLGAWLAASPVGARIEAVCKQEFDDERGFPSLMRRVMDVTRPETIEQFLRELSTHVRRSLRLDIGGSAALILRGHLSKKTEDIDVVDEVPAEFRSQHQLLSELQEKYGLELAHFQRHYLPMGWEQRLHSLPPFGRMQVYLVDLYDVFLRKLFSARTKDQGDLRVLHPQLDKEILVRKLKETTQSMLAAPGLREKAEKNWYILYGEPLPS
jgi:hypothetical protein